MLAYHVLNVLAGKMKESKDSSDDDEGSDVKVKVEGRLSDAQLTS